jgi:hypothetical protein
MSGPPKTPTHLRLVRVTHLSERSTKTNQSHPKGPNTEAFRQAGEVLV